MFADELGHHVDAFLIVEIDNLDSLGSHELGAPPKFTLSPTITFGTPN